MLAENFLNNAKNILDQQKEEKSKGSELNIFTILNKETDEESTHCRFIYELLSPNGSHNQGDTFLKLFFKTVLDVSEEKYPTGYIVVRREACLTTDSRLDLMIDTDSCCYLIEAKINAGEQPEQIKRYCEWAEKRGKDYSMYFLTLDGHVSNTTDKYECTCISFETHIIKWLEECEKLPNISNIPTLIGAIEQYLQLLNKLTGKEAQNMKELNTLIKNNIEIAQRISQQLPIVKGEMVGQVLRDIESYILEEHHLKPKNNVIDYYNDDGKYQKYYGKGGKNPRITFELFTEENSDYSYCLSIVVEYSLFIGCDILRLDSESNKFVPIEIKKDDKIKYNDKYLLDKYHQTSSLWYWWEYLKYNGNNINFYEQNENFYKLFNETEYPLILKAITSEIDKIMEQLKNK